MGSEWSRFSHVWLFAAPWTVASQVPLSMGFSTQEYWSGLPRPSPGELPDPGIEPMSLMSPALAGGFFTTSTTWEAHSHLDHRADEHGIKFPVSLTTTALRPRQKWPLSWTPCFKGPYISNLLKNMIASPTDAELWPMTISTLSHDQYYSGS